MKQKKMIPQTINSATGPTTSKNNSNDFLIRQGTIAAFRTVPACRTGLRSTAVRQPIHYRCPFPF